MAGIEGTGVIQPGSPQVAPPAGGRKSAAQGAELTLSTRSGHTRTQSEEVAGWQ